MLFIPHRLLLAALLLTTSAGTAEAATLARFDFDSPHDTPAGTAAIVPDFLIVRFGHSEARDGLTDLSTLVFDGLELGATSAGQAFTLLSAADDAQLPAFIARATNVSLDDARIDVIGNTTGGPGLAIGVTKESLRHWCGGISARATQACSRSTRSDGARGPRITLTSCEGARILRADDQSTVSSRS